MATEQVHKEIVREHPRGSNCPYALLGKMPTKYAFRTVRQLPSAQTIGFIF